MRTIYKFGLKPLDFQIVEIQGLLKVLSAKEQYNNMVLYAMVDTDDKEITKVKIAIRGTGHELGELYNKPYKFINTIKLEGDKLMFHIFLMEVK